MPLISQCALVLNDHVNMHANSFVLCDSTVRMVHPQGSLCQQVNEENYVRCPPFRTDQYIEVSNNKYSP